MLRGALAAAVTPLRDGELDEPAFGPYVDFLVAGGLDGALVLGTTGESMLFATEERRQVLELYVEASAGRLQLAAHCGAQTTRDTVAVETPASLATSVMDVGPGAGDEGGRIIGAGEPARIARLGGSRTAPYLARYLDG